VPTPGGWKPQLKTWFCLSWCDHGNSLPHGLSFPICQLGRTSNLGEHANLEPQAEASFRGGRGVPREGSDTFHGEMFLHQM
jgi:hypothetical protein